MTAISSKAASAPTRLPSPMARSTIRRPASRRTWPTQSNLAKFVARTLDNAEESGAKQTWIDLVDHGGGDGGGLETHTGAVMSMPDMAQAIADGIALHAKEHPEDAHRKIDGVVANQCLMSTLGFADALSRVGVKYLAASPETMLSPGVPTGVADAIARSIDDPNAMASGVVERGDAGALRNAVRRIVRHGGRIRRSRLFAGETRRMPNARSKRSTMQPERTVADRAALRRDIASVKGMVRFPDATPDMPWHADRPAIAMYDTIAADAKVSSQLRDDARAAADATRALVLAHKESRGFAPFDGASYADAAGPTIHAPLSPEAARSLGTEDQRNAQRLLRRRRSSEVRARRRIAINPGRYVRDSRQRTAATSYRHRVRIVFRSDARCCEYPTTPREPT